MIVTLAALAFADPVELTHQGRVIGASGAPVTGAHRVTVELFDVATGGSSFHSEEFTTVPFDDGYYSVAVGANGLLDGTELVGDRWVGVSIDGVLLTPRQKLRDVPGTQPVASGKSPDTAAFSCKALYDAGVRASGVYWINPTAQEPVRTWCDMVTDGGGWTLVSHAFNRSTGQDAGRNRNHHSLRCGGGDWHPSDRMMFSGAIRAVELARASTEIAFGISVDGDVVSSPNLGGYDRAYKFAIPNPSAVTFENHSYYYPNEAANSAPPAGPCVAVTLFQVGGGSLGTQYTFQDSLGVTWTDTYPTGYGVSDQSNCINAHNGKAFVTSIHTGSYRNATETVECDVYQGSLTYTHRGSYTHDGVNRIGGTTIWLR
jgi:hypothetical protein